MEPIGEGARVLVVDDDPFITRSVARALRSRHEVTAFNSSLQALAAIEKGERYDVILCDLQMPVLNGEAFRASVHAVSPDLAERIVFMTGATSIAPFMKDVASNRRLEKPFRVEELRAAISDLMRDSGAWKASLVLRS